MTHNSDPSLRCLENSLDCNIQGERSVASRIIAFLNQSF
jgi:hypothetical protein